MTDPATAAPAAGVHGVNPPGFERVRTLMAANLASGADLGASYAVTRDGEMIVDLWGGWADVARTRPWERDTIVNVWSTTKTMTALCALMLADRGRIDFSAPVATYWPEFAQNGKEGVTVAHLMSHTAGLPTWREPVTRQDLYDWSKVTRMLAEQAPRWEPGTQAGYHAITQGYLVGEVVRRVDGRSLGTFFREEIAEPLGADFHIGLPASEDARVAEMIPPPRPPADAKPGNPPVDPTDTATRAWRGAEIPAAGGTGNARAVAAIHAILANGGEAGGRRFLSEAGVRRALEVQFEGTDRVLGMPARYGLGFGVGGGKTLIPFPHADSIYWGGWGGSLALIDLEARTSFAFVMNRMAGGTTGDTRAIGLAMATWEALRPS